MQADAKWGDAVRRVIACVVAVWLALMVSHVVAQDDEGAAGELEVTITDAIAIEETSEVQLFVTVSGPGGQPVTGLGRDAFGLREKPSQADERLIEEFIVQTESEARAAEGDAVAPPPLSIALAIDTSQSMSGRPIEEARGAAIEFVDSRPEGDEIALFAFSSDVRRVHDFTTDKSAIRDAIQGLEAGGGTALYEAVHGASSSLTGRGERRAFVMLTDGQNDTDLPRTRDDAIQSARRAEAPAYMLGFGTTLDAALEPIARETGGRYLVRPGPDEIRGLLGDLSQLLDQYVLRYVPEVESSETKYRVTVEVDSDGATGSDFLFVVVPPATATPEGGADVGAESDGVCDSEDPDDPDCEEDRPLPLWLIAAAVGAVAVAAWTLRPGSAPDRGGKSVMTGERPSDRDPVPPPRSCEHCGREMEAEWDACLFCAAVQNKPGPVNETPPEDPGKTAILEPDRPDGTVILQPGAWLVVEEGPMQGREFHLSRSMPGAPRAAADTYIGRGADNHIVLDKDPSVSRKHARVIYRDGKFEIFDHSQPSSMLVNGRGANGHRLAEGDRITLGRTVLVFMEQGESP